MGQYRGNCEIEEISPERCTVDVWGLDLLTRTYKGRATGKNAFINELTTRRDKNDTVFKGMFMMDWTYTVEGPWVTFSVVFRGKKDNRDIEPRLDSGSRVQEVQLQFIGDELGVTTGNVASFTYNAPFTRVFYARRRKPVAIVYRDKLETTRDAIAIVSRSGTPGDLTLFRGRSLNGSALAGSAQNLSAGALNCYNGVLEIMSTLNFEKVGQWYEIVETHEARIIPLELANGTFIYQV